MPKFAKGSPEAVEFMKQLRENRGNKRPITTHKEVSKEQKQIILNKVLEKYYMVSTPIVEVPDKVIKIDKKGDAKLKDTLTKAGNLKKVDGENVIKLEKGDNLVVKTEGKKYNYSVNIPTQTIVHKTEHKTRGPQIQATIKDYNDVIDVKN